VYPEIKAHVTDAEDPSKVRSDDSADDPRSFHASMLGSLFEKAAQTSAFDLACTLLRVGGLEMEDWDSFQETRAALTDYNWILEKVEERGDTSA
jgi:hypothetical protein